eukprot:CAMPEP_0196814974 /NCGR_PEP_ID=MMETSP1362-20130617/47147_1 /TAXON_ID=163516 /ORGANISM="Leptocylindrus danicus, Strain CCMP1856" /LENGTH=518 /DNA_ID=CAMNT_0042191785 /DNA_START=118 /DNA_END=1674 /DNA_ORIENTATION=+
MSSTSTDSSPSSSSSIAGFLRNPRRQGILQEPSSPTVEVMKDYVISAVVEVDRGTTTSTWMEDVVMPIISTSLLITANTVGAGTMILPDVAAGPGFAAMVAAFVGVWVMNLISSLLISDIAIQQYESSGCQSSAVPSSFKEFADETMGSTAGNIMSAISLFTNMCVLAFAIMTSGEVVHGVLDSMDLSGTSSASSVAGLLASSNSSAIAATFAAIIALLSMTLPSGMLSNVSSACATVLFASFAAVVLPGMYHIGDPMPALANMNIAGTAGVDNANDLLSSLKAVLPIIITISTYQNITPTVTKLLNFDRFQVLAATVIGSGIPVCMYVMWMYVNMASGSVDMNMNAASSMINAFMASSLVGSSIACTISIAEEFESLLLMLSDNDDSDTNVSSDTQALPSNQILSVPSVLMSVIPCLVAGLLFAEEGGFNAALDVAGKYGSTVLYGLFPVALGLAHQQQQKGDQSSSNVKKSESLVPGGVAPMAMLGAATMFYMGSSFVADMNLESLFVNAGAGIVS